MSGEKYRFRALLFTFFAVFVMFSLPIRADDIPSYNGPRFTENLSDNLVRSLRSLEDGLNQISKKARPAVVTIFVQKQVTRSRGFPFRFQFPFRPQRKKTVRGLGSGVIIRSNGYIVTNHHVIEDMSKIKVLLPNQEKVEARVVASDPKTDLAVLKIRRKNLPNLDFADSNNLKIGQWAIAIGSPFSLQNSVSYGHVSALQRTIQIAKYENFIQTDAPINRGNSGGPLVNIEGEIIGINTVIQSTSGGSQGVGFANASNLVKRTVTDLIENGKVSRPWIGVSIQKLPERTLQRNFGYDYGALVSEIKKNSPAHRAGIRPGDLIIKVDEKTINNPAEFQQSIIAHDIEEEISLSVVREGKKMTLTVKLSERPGTASRTGTESTGQKLLREVGLSLKKIDKNQARRMGFDRNQSLILIDQVRRGSIAYKSGIRPNDLILSINRDPISSLKTFRKNVGQLYASGNDSILLLIQRNRSRDYVTIPLPDLE